MERIAIYDSSSGSTPPITIATNSVSVVYGAYINSNDYTRYLRENSPSGGWVNLFGGGANATSVAPLNNTKGNILPATFKVVSDFYIAIGEVQGTFTLTIELFKDGESIQSWSITPTGFTLFNLAFDDVNLMLEQGHAYSLKFTGVTGTDFLALNGWSLALSFQSYE
jgi:hypothetical protein